MKQLDLICSVCPMKVCDTHSLFCMYRFLTHPNAAQREAAKGNKGVKLRPPKRGDRSEYYRNYYLENRDKKLAEANERHARKRNENNRINNHSFTNEK